MKRRITLVAGLVMMAFLVAACGIKGNGNVIEENRDVSGFDEIQLSGIGIVKITQGASESLTIAAESNIMPLLRSDVRGNALVLETKPNTNINPTRDIVYSVTIKDLSRIEVSGAGTVESSSLETNTLTIELSGAGSITIGTLNAASLDVTASGAGQITIENGTVPEQNVTISGAGNYQVRGLQSEIAQLTLSGAGNATLSVSNELTGEVSGVGSINYVGNPTVDVSTSGVGTVNKLADE